MLYRLFDVFDDGDGVVDRKLFFSGLTVLCDGERDSKIRAAFDLYDEDKDGFISLEQVCFRAPRSNAGAPCTLTPI